MPKKEELLEEKTVKDLKQMARDKELSGYSNMRKADLMDLIDDNYTKAEIQAWSTDEVSGLSSQGRLDSLSQGRRTMSHRISVSNQKGGVGKTTICLHLAVALARRDREVLLVDLDPSAYLSAHLGFDRDYYNENKNSLAYHLVYGSRENPKEAIIGTDEGVDLVPSNYDMRGVEDRLSAERNREMRLKMFLDKVDQDYDYVMVDSPPSLGPLYDNAILACRCVVIPIKDEDMSVVSIHRVLDEIEEIENAFGTSVEILAIVPNLVRPDGVATDTLESLRNTDGLKEYMTPFEIRQRVAIRRSMKNRATLYRYEPECDQIENFERLADLVISKCEGG